MRIGIDARMYGPTHSGIGRYVEQLIKQLKLIDADNEYVVFLKKEAFDTFEIPNYKWKKVLADVHWYGIAEQWSMPRIIKREHVDLMHFPHWNVPLLYRKKFVVTIHDLIMFHFSRKEATTHNAFVYMLKDYGHRLLVRSTAKRAEHIYTTSEFTKHDIVQTLGVDAEKISVTYQAPFTNSEFRIQNSESILKKADIVKPYVLYVGNAYPHKNLVKLIEAFKHANERLGDTHQLVLAGKKSPFYESVEDSAGFDASIVFAGFVTDEELHALYSGAALYAFPSQYEGFGLPPLEAMVHNIPVVSSNASCMPEVLGNAALYFDPDAVDDMSRVIQEALSNEEIRYVLREQAKIELKRYSWRKLAEQTIQKYKQHI